MTLLEELTQRTCDLMRIESIDTRPDQLEATIEYVAQFVETIPQVFVHRGVNAGKPYLIATLHDTKNPRFMLNAHLDVVPARPEQFVPELRDGRIYGRGSQDMKGAAAVLLCLLRDLAALEQRPDVGFMFVTDEEIGGIDGTNYLLQQGWGCEFFLAAEPTDLAICFEQKAAMWLEVTLRGVPAHGSRPWAGVNTISLLRDCLVALEERFPTPTEESWVTTVVPTVVHGGEAGNRLPETLKMSLDIRRIPTQSAEEVFALLNECFPAGAISTALNGPPLMTDPEDAFVQSLAEQAAAVTGKPTHFYREHFASDARFYSEAKIPSVCFGPVGAGLHSDEEWVEIASLGQLYQILHRFVLA
jgi:succinyl-diaminopimelate desuccinylase